MCKSKESLGTLILSVKNCCCNQEADKLIIPLRTTGHSEGQTAFSNFRALSVYRTENYHFNSPEPRRKTQGEMLDPAGSESRDTEKKENTPLPSIYFPVTYTDPGPLNVTLFWRALWHHLFIQTSLSKQKKPQCCKEICKGL